jgi:hypothetical protein
MEQLLQAEQLAAEWLKKTQKPSPASIRDANDRPANTVLRAVSK